MVTYEAADRLLECVRDLSPADRRRQWPGARARLERLLRLQRRLTTRLRWQPGRDVEEHWLDPRTVEHERSVARLLEEIERAIGSAGDSVELLDDLQDVLAWTFVTVEEGTVEDEG